MCGLIFAVLPKPVASNSIDRAARFVKTRGPSSSHCDSFISKYGYSIHAVHYLLDVSGNSVIQPLHWPNYSSPNLTLLFNGEIYNYKSLYPDATSDTEALLPLFLQYGSKLWQKLDGEYAILIYDHQSCQVHIAVDSFLTKPLCIGFNMQNGAFGVASYPSALQFLGFESPIFFEPNTSATFKLAHPDSWIDNIYPAKKSKTYFYNLEQDITNFDRWEKAFLDSIYKRASHGTLPVFVPLSSGYDSGSICLALNILRIKYVTITIDSQEHTEIIEQRIKINKAASCIQAIKLKPLSKYDRCLIKQAIASDCEPFQYLHTNQTLHNDEGALGAYRVAQVARSEKLFICLSGCGADEIISDYGHNGHKFYDHSEFGGYFPESLEGFFPWKKFYGDSMRSYLFKDELIFGLFGIEGRYPFLDPSVVQAFLSIAAKRKNMEYKAPIAAFLRHYNYPFEPGVKRGFSPSPNDVNQSLIQRLKRGAMRLRKKLTAYI